MTVNFTTQVQTGAARFSVPKSVLDQLGLGYTGSVYLLIRSASGKKLFEGTETLKMGTQIRGKAIANAVKPGDQILVEVSAPPPNHAGGKDWSDSEVKVTVADYFAMLNAELKGESFSKTAHRNTLLKLLSNRSPQAVEFKHCNISAVLREMELTYISGYKPRGNYQDLLEKAVKQYLIANPEPRKAIVELDANPIESPPDGSKFVLAEIEVQPPLPVERGGKRPGKPVKTDWGAAGASSRKLGKQGEKFVFDLECRRLRDAGRSDLEGDVEWISDTQGDGAGYDIRSFDVDGEEIFIEVKTTKGPEATAFYISANELTCSEERGASYKLYRVFDFGKAAPKLYRLSGPLAAKLDLQVKVYSATCAEVKTSPAEGV